MSRKTHAPDYVLLITIGAVTFFGLLMLASASSVLGLEKFGDPFFYLKRQVLFGLLPGLAAFFILARIPYQNWRRFAGWLLLISVGLLLAVFIPGLGLKLGGARSWLGILGYTVQPAEIVKLTFLLYLAAWLERRRDDLSDVRVGLGPFILIIILVALPVILQPDIGTVSVILSIAVATFFVAGVPLSHLLSLALGGLAAFYGLIKLAPYRAARLTIYLNPELDPQGLGYHISQALLAVGSGGLLGLGLGHSRQKFAYLPEAAGDSIFAIAAEELGFIMALFIIVLFSILVYRALRIARLAPDLFGRLIAVGIAVWIGVQALLNIGAMVGVFPLTGLPLPLVSQGGTALLALLAALGILINISRQTGERVRSARVKVRRKL